MSSVKERGEYRKRTEAKVEGKRRKAKSSDEALRNRGGVESLKGKAARPEEMKARCIAGQ